GTASANTPPRVAASNLAGSPGENARSAIRTRLSPTPKRSQVSPASRLSKTPRSVAATSRFESAGSRRSEFREGVENGPDELCQVTPPSTDRSTNGAVGSQRTALPIHNRDGFAGSATIAPPKNVVTSLHVAPSSVLRRSTVYLRKNGLIAGKPAN